MKQILILIFFVAFVWVTSLQAQNNTKVNLDFTNNVQGWLSENHVPTVGIGIIENGQIKYIKVFGELKKGFPAPGNAIFNVASMTKPLFAMMALKLAEAGQWDLDEPLFHYWTDPDVASDPFHKELTTRHVLTHQSGFVNWRRQNANKKLTFDFEPGTKYQYSGEGFVYLGNALERKFKKTLVELADSILFKPLGMKDSRLYWDKTMDRSRFACWHDSNGNMLEPSTPKDRGVNAAGSLMATIEDYCKFGIDLINGAGLSSELDSDMVRPQVKIGEHHARGLGWGIVTDLPNGEYALEHGGSDMGVQTMCIFLPKSKRGVVVFTNGDNGMLVYRDVIKESLDFGQTLLDYIYDVKIHKVITLTDDILEQYAGNFKDSYGRNLTITKGDGVLEISGNGVPTLKLYPETNTKFFSKEFEIQFEFIQPDSMVVTVNGKIDMTAKRIK